MLPPISQNLQSPTNTQTLTQVTKVPFSPSIGRNETHPKIIAPASTFKFTPKSSPALPESETTPEDKHGFPAGSHWVDWAEPGTIAVIDQPAGQNCAVLGGIMAVRMRYLGVAGTVVNGRIRDLGEITGCGLPVSFTLLSLPFLLWLFVCVQDHD